jgi:hypothetical protein
MSRTNRRAQQERRLLRRSLNLPPGAPILTGDYSCPECGGLINYNAATGHTHHYDETETDHHGHPHRAGWRT